jgi:molybdopterin/thiamine biosynthesis adenylyltransferase
MLKSGVMSVYVAEQGHDGIDLRLGQPHVIPLAADLERLATRVGGRVGPTTLVDIEGCVYIGSSINAPDFELQVLVGAGYPFSAPIVLLTTVSVAGTARTASSPLAQAGTAGATVSLPLTWDLAVADEDRIAIAMRPHLEPVARVEAARDGIGARLVGVTSQSLRSKRVVLVGAGSGGSMTADMLVRSGVERFVVIDPDYVDPANLSRSVYTAADVGKLKVEALRGHLLAVNPQAVCEVVPSALSEIRTTELADLVAGSDLVVAATDDPSAQRLVNHLAYAKGIPSLYAGVYARGHAGEVVFVVPEITRCYRCVTASRHSLSDMEQSTDYGTGRLTAEPALGADILHVVTASVKLALGLLEIEEETAARDFLFGALSAGHSYLILSMVPDYSFFPKVFKEVPNQYAYQSAWLSATGDPECPVCGSDRIDPLASPTKAAPRVSQLRPVELAAQPSTARRGRGGRRR